MNYTTQIDDFSCGPTAIYNALVWSRAAHRPSRRQLFQYCQCEPQFGTLCKPLTETLDTVCADPRNTLCLKKTDSQVYWQGTQVTFKLIKDALLSGEAVLLDFHWELDGEADEHYVLLVDIKDAATDRGGDDPSY